MRFRKKPVIIEAIQYTVDNEDECIDFGIVAGEFVGHIGVHGTGLVIRTLEGMMNCSKGDWIIKGVKGEFYPCKPDIFEATYEPETSAKEPSTK